VSRVLAPAIRPTDSPGIRGEGWGEGLCFKFIEKRGENPVQILNDVIVPEPDNAVTEGMELGVALPVLDAL
jgi:hypothetical protein